ncbi:MAG: hypothetical protein ACYC56_00985 [Candidatus Aquicultor sp.]
MAETPEQTRREIEETRMRIAEATEELEERIQSASDWRRIVHNYPLESAAGALVAGFLLSSLLVPGVINGFRAIGRRQETPQVQSRRAGILGFIRPFVTPIITARMLDYMRRRAA